MGSFRAYLIYFIARDRDKPLCAAGPITIRRKNRQFHPSVGIKTGTGREVEALVHELLHINLIQLGFPRLCSNTVEGDAYGVAKGIINIADHRLILPKFLQMEFAEELFLTPLPHVEALPRMLQRSMKVPYTTRISSIMIACRNI